MPCVNEVKGDLFECPKSWSLAHCISADCKMGKGIALQFRNRFQRVQELRKQGKVVGEVAILKVDQEVNDEEEEEESKEEKEEEKTAKKKKMLEKFVYNLVTKEKFWMKPKMESVHKCVMKMKEHCETKKVSNVAMPRIGCGLDRLDWSRVKQMLNEIFKETNIQITVYYM